MNQTHILYPAFAIILLTFGIALWMLKLRFGAVKAGELKPRYFKIYRDGKEPEKLTQVTHNFDNLLQIPILFYTVCIAALASSNVDHTLYAMAWLFVAARFLHSYIHTTYNHVLHRMRIFVFSSLLVLAMWSYLIFKIATH